MSSQQSIGEEGSSSSSTECPGQTLNSGAGLQLVTNEFGLSAHPYGFLEKGRGMRPLASSDIITSPVTGGDSRKPWAR
jgi:hypothetical protein